MPSRQFGYLEGATLPTLILRRDGGRDDGRHGGRDGVQDGVRVREGGQEGIRVYNLL